MSVRRSDRPETILVVDDEPVVLALVASILEHAGYDVLRAGSPHEALRIGLEHTASIDLLLADVIMPGLSGPALAEEFAAVHPETRWLFMAGLPDSDEIADRIIARGKPFLPKPFFPRVLVGKVEEVLDTRTLAATAGA